MKRNAGSAELGGIDPNAAAWMTPHVADPWHWDTDGESIMWAAETTVAMAEELAQICERYGEQPLPPLTAIVAVLAALKGRLPEALPPEALASLRTLAGWAPNLTRTVAAKHALLDTLFHSLAESTAPDGLTLAHTLRCGWRPGVDEVLTSPHEDYFSYAMLASALKRVSPEQLRYRLETGVEGPVRAAPELPEMPGISPKSLAEELSMEPETAGLLRLTRDIMAALTLPRIAVGQEDQVAGGFADLGTRGPLHRLLLSELAHDDDMLAARLALNEAMYLQPEPPACQPPGAQTLVLDSGLRLWGAARLFALSAALALWLKARPGATHHAWRARQGAWQPVDLGTVEGVKNHLAALETSYDLTPSLASLPAVLEDAGGKQEVVLLVHEETFLDPHFRREVSTHLDAYAPLHVVAVNAQGSLTLHRFSRQGFMLLHQARLNLEKLAPDSRPLPHGAAVGGGIGAARPAIYFLPEFPFLIAPTSPVISTVTVPATGLNSISFSLTQGREIWYQTGSQQGARPVPMPALRGKLLDFRLHEGAAPGAIAAAWDQPRNQVSVVVISSPSDGNPPAPRTWIMGGVESHPLSWWVDGDHFVVLATRTVRAIRLTDGHELARRELPDELRHLGERHFFSSSRPPFPVHHCLIQGNAISFADFGNTESSRPLLTFHRKGQLGMWLVGANGAIVSPSGSHHTEGLAFPHRLISAKTDPDGSQVWMKTQQGQCFIRDLDSGHLTSRAPDQSSWPFYVHRPRPVHFTMRTRFEVAGVTAGGEVALRTSRGRVTVITLSSTWFRLEERPAAQVHAWCQFTEPEVMDVYGQARPASWPSGSRILLDDRGLLHLQPANASLPEVTIGLPSNTMLPAWSSDGLLVGPAAAQDSGRPRTEDARAIETHIKNFAMEILQ